MHVASAFEEPESRSIGFLIIGFMFFKVFL
jgi:hypothetical protein